MNFFEHQEQARRRTGRLVVLFALAVLLIVVVIDVLAVVFLGTDPKRGESWLSGDTLANNLGLILGVAAAVVGVIALASVLRTVSLRGGGGKVARQLGGTPVRPEATDPLRRRLHNVVEEMAIASGVPVPEVYVLEGESGINAFAAGYSTADAAVAVTQGALEQLDRDELQGVIAHEFSHILNGDMRLNIRLIGLLFGILALAIIGRIALGAMRHSRDRGAAAIAAIGLALLLVGYIGLFFGRWIQASVSRQREYLADASAVQFTRNPTGLAGALKRIGATQVGSRLRAETDEVSHMLFAGGAVERIFATHPPLEKRIRAIEPSFQPEEIEEIAKQMQRDAAARRAEVEREAVAEGERRRERAGAGALDPDSMIEAIGVPGVEQVLAAGALAAAIPDPMTQAARSLEWAPEVLCYLLVDRDPQARAAQLGMIRQVRGAESERQVRELLEVAAELPAEQRLPLLEIAFPAIRRRPEAELRDLLGLIDRLVAANRRISVFEYALARLTAVQVEDALHPERARPVGRRRLAELPDDAAALLAGLARHGQRDEASARAAYDAGIVRVLDDPPPMPAAAEEWPARLDRALAALDQLRPKAKQRLVAGLAAVALHDAEVVTAELELLRAVCATIHVPLPVLDAEPVEEPSGR